MLYIVHVAACFFLMSPLDTPTRTTTITQKNFCWSWLIILILAMAKSIKLKRKKEIIYHANQKGRLS